ncbi:MULTISPECIES: Gfo/Idh/MocA family protein [Haloarcula]|uniref:Oxidoreductase n=1 Tax=Haloarcula pellucida TaxID=1427151 RepID=A0A830GJH8_9EURY|nr:MULTISPECIES: Gfo/Idh/MocA family oxidoreductase [Halomicroarcula]MBX0347371.1 Gfo/Idh/MocA family oxidoreductase [Halomicroarcula pellucida]MDS0276755.1 Gfo/Idh/MocA family oxidoreductase [Halomicroarcula sp. S1AR25-4]GGN88337.1 oxidoreductase [Halomicroarcula pellucida]
MNSTEPLAAGVVGVGSMGTHHARVYNEIPGVDLVGVADADPVSAAETAAEYGTSVADPSDLLQVVDLVSVAVPTRFHYDVAMEAIEAGVSVLIEKPFVRDLQNGQELIDRAAEVGVTLQVGHIERFNPVVDVLQDVLADVEPIAASARRLGPPVSRDVNDDVVMDLMIHDIDVVCSLFDDEVVGVTAVGACDGDYADAQMEFAGGTVCSLTASRITQERIRDLSVTTRECHVAVDFMDQSMRIYRHSDPSYHTENGDVRYTQESIIERPAVESDEPLKRELRSFVECVSDGTTPRITGEDGLRALSIARDISDVASSRSLGLEEVSISDCSTT